MFISALICIILPCIMIQGQYLVNGNISWLLIGAERLLDGKKLSEHIYETNPPLSIIAYTPHVIFSKLLGLPVTVGTFYLTLLFVFISVYTAHSITKHFDFLTISEQNVFTLSYMLAVTLGTTVFFSEREHFLILALVPMLLCQYSMARNINIQKSILIPVMIVGALCIMIKPHYGLLPTIFIIDRMIRLRKFNVFFDIDFATLSVITVAYIASLFIFFSDYINVIFDDVVKLYASNISPIIAINLIKKYMFACFALLILEIFMEDLNKQKKSFLLFLYLCSLLCLVPYFVQMKGFFNHITPVYTFLICSLTLSIAFRVPYFFKRMRFVHTVIPMICIAFFIHMLTPLSLDFPKQNTIPSLPVAKFLEEECDKPCTFFAFHGDIEIINPTAAYMGYTHATRFPSMWFIPKILLGLQSEDQKERDLYKSLKSKYLRYTADDLEYYEPSVIMIASGLQIGKLKSFDFMYFFRDDKKFKSIIDQNYEKLDQFKFNRGEYFTGTTLEDTHILTYDVYRRKQVTSL